MSLSFLLRLHAILAAIYAIALLVAPRQIIGLMSDAPLNEIGVAVTRLFGAALVLVTLLTWGTSKLRDAGARRLVTVALFVYTGLGAILTLLGQIAGTWNMLGWVNVLSYLIFFLGYGYFLFIRPE